MVTRANTRKSPRRFVMSWLNRSDRWYKAMVQAHGRRRLAYYRAGAPIPAFCFRSRFINNTGIVGPEPKAW